ncbi:sensor histidine kinase [Glutamicibacter sp.]|uniref:sensor histidine kinase n=1 Tax=Glutamicibacter sp. TaxID=1931995 RepID=UPI002FD9DACF
MLPRKNTADSLPGNVPPSVPNRLVPEQSQDSSSNTALREAAVALTTFFLCLLGGIFHADDTVGAPGALAYVVAALSAALVLARHRIPVIALAAATVCALLVTPLGLLPTPLIIAPVIVISYAMTSRSERASSWLLIFTAVVLIIGPMLFFGGVISWEDSSRLGTVAAAPLMAGVLGRSTRHRRAYLDSIQERARRAEETRDSEARRKVAEERLRIARELHDLVAHQVTLANAQAAVAERLFDTQPDKARSTLRDLLQTTRNALDELRAAVGLLRQQDDESQAPEPAPGIAQLSNLFGSFTQIGLAVELRSEGSDRVLPPAVDLTAYRVVQEALTNTAKHSTAKTAQVQLAWEAKWLTIKIIDPGPARRTDPQRSSGYGLLGMGERSSAVGGEFSTQRPASGGFAVTVRLPLHIADNPDRIQPTTRNGQ